MRHNEALLDILDIARQQSTAGAIFQAKLLIYAVTALFLAIGVGLLWSGLASVPWFSGLGVLVLAFCAYSWYFRANLPRSASLHTTPSTFSSVSSPGQRTFNQRRRDTFPGPYPNGWYLLVRSEELVAGAPPKSFSVFGRQLIAFRGGVSHQPAVLDAHCPHLGAHLGIDSRVVGDCVECPFHQWQFDVNGICQAIPYLPNQGKSDSSSSPSVAQRMKTRRYPTFEKIGCVFVWFDAEDREPLWSQPLIPGSLEDGSMYYGGVTHLTFGMHISEMFENSADLRHFNTLHAPFPLWPLSYFLRLKHDIQLGFPAEGKPDGYHICLFREVATVYLFDWFPIAPTQVTNIYFDGPSIMHFMMKTIIGRVHIMKTMLPIAPFQLVTEDRWYCDHHLPRWFGWLMARIGSNALDQDRTVWENKIYRTKPMLVQGERPFLQHRQWYRQFYSPSSVRFNSPNPDSSVDLSW